MEEITVYYSVRNGGDGSAYPTFMESSELCEWDQNHMDEGWGESCDGSISFESDSPITCTYPIVTKEIFWIEHFKEYGEHEEDEEDFLNKFFPDGLPTFRIETRDHEKSEHYDLSETHMYNDIFIGDKLITTVTNTKEQSGEIFEKVLNSTKNV